MKIYQLYYADYDGGSDYWFTHPHKLFSEFQQDCIDLLNKYKEDVFDAKKQEFEYVGWIGVPDLVDVISKRLPELGYASLVYECFGFGGSSILRDEMDREEEILKYLPKDFVDKIFEHNIRMENA